MIRAVTFDFWNTLVREYERSREHRVAAIVSAFAEHGIDRSTSDVEAAIGELRVYFDERWLANQVVDPELGARQVVTALGLDAVPELLGAVATVFHTGNDPSLLTVAPGIGRTLDALKSAGVRVGIISDTGFAPGATLRRYLDHHGLWGFFDHASFSDEVGVFKPDSAIFADAAAGLGVATVDEVAHVGDLRRTDIGGATAVGWTAVRYRGLNDDDDDASPDATIIIDNHDDLLAAIGLA